MDILSTLEAKLPTFSKGQKRIAQYIIDDFDQAAFMTAATLGKVVQVSESTVVRFASELGFRGYPQFQKQLQETVLNRLTNSQRMEASQKRGTDTSILTSTLREDAERLKKTQESIDEMAFRAAVEAMLVARRIYILGARSSAALTGFLHYYLRYIFDDVRLITATSASSILQELVRLGREDVLISISYPRYCSGVLKAQEFAHDVGAKTVVLTDSTTSPLAKDADCLLLANSDIISLVGSLVAPMSVVNALIAACANKRREQTTEVLDKLEDIWDAYHVYEKYDE